MDPGFVGFAPNLFLQLLFHWLFVCLYKYFQCKMFYCKNFCWFIRNLDYKYDIKANDQWNKTWRNKLGAKLFKTRIRTRIQIFRSQVNWSEFCRIIGKFHRWFFWWPNLLIGRPAMIALFFLLFWMKVLQRTDECDIPAYF